MLILGGHSALIVQGPARLIGLSPIWPAGIDPIVSRPELLSKEPSDDSVASGLRWSTG